MSAHPDLWIIGSDSLKKNHLSQLDKDLRNVKRRLSEYARKIEPYYQEICRTRRDIKVAEDYLADVLHRIDEKHKELNWIIMPDVPVETQEIPNEEKVSLLPEKSGIYFFWSGNRVVYVGQSIRLCNRVTRRHNQYVNGDKVSYLFFEVNELSFSECYYIWRCRPERNREAKGYWNASRAGSPDVEVGL